MSYASEVLADSPLWFAQMNEASGSSFADDAGNSHTGTWTASPTVVSGLVADGGNARTLNGSTQYGEVAYGTWMESLPAFTIEAVVKSTATSGSIVARVTSAPAYRIGFTGGKAFVECRTGVSAITTLVSGATTVNDNVRHHIAGTWDGSTLRIYVDGTLDGSGAKGNSLVSNAGSALRVGQRNSDSFWAGTVDATAIYGAELSATRIAAHAAAAFTTSGVTGTLATTLADATLAASGAETVTGTLASTLAGATLAGSGVEKFTGTLAATLAGATLAASGGEAFSGSFSATLAGATLAADAAETITGSLSVALDDVSLVATSEEDITGSLAATLEGAALAAEGSSVFGASGVLEVTLDGVLLTASGVETISGAFLVTLDDATLVATGSTHQPFRDIKVLALVDVSRLIEPVDVSRDFTFTETPRELTITEEVYA